MTAAEKAAGGRKSPLKIAILGGGAWGTALGCVLARKYAGKITAKTADAAEHNIAADAARHNNDSGCDLMLFCRRAEQAAEINAARRNSAFLPDIALPRGMRATADMREAALAADYILAAVPAQAMRAVLTDLLQAGIAEHIPLILCSKGIEKGSGQFMTQAARSVFRHNPLALLSGPSFAADIARGLPAAVTVAAEHLAEAEYLARAFSSDVFRCYASADIKGVEIGGSLKNVLALAAGMAAGCGFGASAQAALITRGFAELRRFCRAFGGKAETVTGLAVLGDLVLTCSSPQSRNYAYGFAYAKGEDVSALPLAEGVATAPAAADLCRKHGIEAPLVTMTAALLAGECTIEQAVKQLLARPLKIED